MRVGLVCLLAFCACSDGFEMFEPAAGPAAAPPHAIDPLTTLDGETLTDANALGGSCSYTFLWTERDGALDWGLVAVDGVLLDREGKDELGIRVLCDLAARDGPNEYRVPLGELAPGIYTACAGNGCVEPFVLE